MSTRHKWQINDTNQLYRWRELLAGSPICSGCRGRARAYRRVWGRARRPTPDGARATGRRPRPNWRTNTGGRRARAAQPPATGVRPPSKHARVFA